MNATKGDKNINLPAANFPTQDGKLKVKSENNVEIKPAKPEADNKKKSASHAESRISSSSMSTSAENSDQSNELTNTNTYPIIPYSPSTSSNSSESNQTEMMTESSTPHQRSSSDIMSYLKTKRIPRLSSRSENQEDSQPPKKHKGESYNSCK